MPNPGTKLPMWDHQRDVVPRLLQSHFILIWEPGTGKTLPLLRAAQLRGGRTLYLCPAALRSQVAREAQLFGCFEKHTIQVIQFGKDIVAAKAKLVVCSYDHAVAEKIWKQLFKFEWDSLILDEAHFLKNTASKRSRAVYGAKINSPGALFRRAGRVWCATGTPIVNNPADLWPHISRLFPEILVELDLKRKEQFIEKFCHVKQTPYGLQILGGRNLPLLKTAIKDIVSRVRKSDVLDMPPLLVTQLWVPPRDLDLSDIPEEALQEVMDLLRNDEVDKLERMAPALATLRRRIGLAKAGHIAEIVSEELRQTTGKILIFYQHTDVAKEMQESLAAKNKDVQSVIYSGGLSTTKRDAIIKQFITDPKTRVMIAQIQAAGVGLNLQCADRVILAEPAWTPAANEQAIARAYRGGQTKKVWASYVLLESSIDESVTSAVIRKSRIIEGAIG